MIVISYTTHVHNITSSYLELLSLTVQNVIIIIIIAFDIKFN